MQPYTQKFNDTLSETSESSTESRRSWAHIPGQYLCARDRRMRAKACREYGKKAKAYEAAKSSGVTGFELGVLAAAELDGRLAYELLVGILVEEDLWDGNWLLDRSLRDWGHQRRVEKIHKDCKENLPPGHCWYV